MRQEDFNQCSDYKHIHALKINGDFRNADVNTPTHRNNCFAPRSRYVDQQSEDPKLVEHPRRCPIESTNMHEANCSNQHGLLQQQCHSARALNGSVKPQLHIFLPRFQNVA